MIGSGSDSSQSDESSQRPQDVQATFCATLVDEWARLGVQHAVVAPGSRSTPMAVALAESEHIAVHVVHDERSAAFVALGLGVDGVPALVLCTSGTAAANFSPAVVEAGLSEIPMVVLTADRPEELRGVGAPQTIDQIELYGSHVRWFHDPGVPTAAGASTWRGIADESVRHTERGPVHLNLPFREPLLGQVLTLPPPGPLSTTSSAAGRAGDLVPAGVARQRGVIVVGGRSGVTDHDVAALSAHTGWPILADPLSGMRHLDGVVTHFESILRSQRFAENHRPAAIVRIGRPATSKTLAQWIDRSVGDGGSVLVQVGGPGVIDPGRNVTATCSIAALIETDFPAVDPAWAAAWRSAEQHAGDAIASYIDGEAALSEPGTAFTVARELPDDAQLVVASSMPVRDLEWFGGPAARAHCNRGANGIDGVTSTGLGVALSGHPTVVLIGDLAFNHDANALLALNKRDVDLRIVVIDNDGGGIFSFLPQSDALTDARFEELFGTPLAVDLLALAAAHGIPTFNVTTSAELSERMQQPGPWVVRVPSTRAVNVEIHAALHGSVVDALEQRG